MSPVIVTGAKRGKKSAREARLVRVLFLIGWESGANFGNQSQSACSKAKPKQTRNYFRQSIENRSIFKRDKLHTKGTYILTGEYSSDRDLTNHKLSKGTF